MSIDSFEEAMELVNGWVEDIGDTSVGRISDNPDIVTENPDMKGFECRHGDVPYLVTAIPEDRYFSVILPRSISNTLASRLDDEILIQFSETDELTMEVKRQAAMDWVHQAEKNVLQEISFHLKERLSNAEVAFKMQDSEKGAPTGFQVERKIYPYEESYSIADFDHSVQAVVSIGVQGINYIATVFNLDTELSEEPELIHRL